MNMSTLSTRRLRGRLQEPSSSPIIENAEVFMTRANYRGFMLSAGAAAIAVAAAFFFVGGRGAHNARADGGTTTEAAAAAVGAQVTPTEPKLRIEPK